MYSLQYNTISHVKVYINPISKLEKLIQMASRMMPPPGLQIYLWFRAGLKTRVDTQKTGGFFWVNPPKNPANPPKFNPVSFLVLLITKDFYYV